jgi:hypothetical protein
MYELVAQGDGSNIATMANYENEFAEGQRGLITLNCYVEVSPDIASALQTSLVTAGVTSAQVTAQGTVVNITFQKGFPWLVVISAAILGLIALAIIVALWYLFREVGVPGSTMLIAGGLIIAAMLAYAYAKSEGLVGST